MSEHKHPTPETQGTEANINKGRRRLSKAALATPVVASLASRPALACSISGFMSGNASPGHGEYQCTGIGCTPGFWKTNIEAWARTPYNPGKCATYDANNNCTSWSSGPGTKLIEILPSGCDPFSAYSQMFMLDILIREQSASGTGNIYTQMAHYIAAVLNASVGNYYGGSFADIKLGLCKAVANQAASPPVVDRYGVVMDVKYYTLDILKVLNEKGGCFLDAHGCLKAEEVWNGKANQCIPVCSQGYEYDPVSKQCVLTGTSKKAP